jgi:pimeloyl-CoA dehydrogenase small subunit
MDFALSEEQQLLKDSVERFVREEYEFEKRRKLAKSEEGFSRAHWKRMAELGWLGAGLPEEFGGIGGGAVERMIVMEQIGRGLVLEPYLATAVLGAGLLLEAGSPEQKRALLPKLAAGELLLAFGHAERQARFDLHDVTTRAEKAGPGWRLSGEKSVVLHAAAADKLIVSARTSGERRARDGIGLFVVDRAAKGLTRRDYPTVDGLRASEVAFDGVEAEAALGEPGKGLPVVERVVEQAVAALCAEAVGAMQVLHDDTNEHLKTRVQFGRPIGQFQVLQHRMVDMFMEVEQARSMMLLATLKLAEPDARERARASSAAKVQIGRSGRLVGQQAIQLHGGMGMTEELRVGHYFKRLTMIDLSFGDVDWHLKRFAAL